MRRNLFICLLLAGVTLAIYWPVRTYDLFRSDDPLFLTETPEIRSGLNATSVAWAMTGTVAANWHPVTILTFIVGHQLWGVNPGAEHLVNAVIHALNAALLFLALNQLTSMPGAAGARGRAPGLTGRSALPYWRCAVAAALFAWHPLRVESVAWIAERKDVLSVFFFLLTLLCYAKAVASDKWQVTGTKTTPTPVLSRVTCHLSRFYWLAVLFFALGLMSKAMLVTLPFVLLLLDFWPLGRVTSGGWRVAKFQIPVPQLSTLNHLLFEKWPFFAMTTAACVITFAIQRGESATPSLTELGLGLRLENAIASYLRYLAWTAWPVNLAAYYAFPYDNHFYLVLWPGWQIGAAALVLILTSALCLRLLGRMPYLAVGWFWYLGTLVPVIGLVQVGGQGMADRYTYIPLIGPVLSLVWLAAEKWPKQFFARALLVFLTAAILAGCLLQTRYQLQFWKDNETMARRTIEVTGENPRVEYLLGLGLEQKGDIRGAMSHYRNAAAALLTVTEAYQAIGRLLSQQGEWAKAERIYAILLAAKPEDFTCRLGLATVLPHLGRMEESVAQLKIARQNCPDTADALNNLAWTLATSDRAELRDAAGAVRSAERACELTHYRETIMVGTLAAAYAEAGRFDEAVATAQKACALATASGQTELLQRNQELLELYRARQPYREIATPAPADTAAPIPANKAERPARYAP
jgi:protein O-mannosyl-transferase